MTFMVSVWQSFTRSQKASCCFGYAALFGPIDAFLRRRLDALPAGFYLHKMYSIRVEGNDVNLQMAAPPVPFQDGMAHALEHLACDVLSSLA